MKILACFLAAVVLISCNAPTFKVGECVQKPDSVVVWKVEKVSDDGMVISQNQNPQIPATQTTAPDQGWIKTECL